jgi:hypothetical protein
LTVSGESLAGMLEQLPVILNANTELEKFHQQRANA